jgi:pimeloyl-ACP methyl ester carboxylesterase
MPQHSHEQRQDAAVRATRRSHLACKLTIPQGEKRKTSSLKSPWQRSILLLAFVLNLTASEYLLIAQDDETIMKRKLNWPTPTLGGTQFWTDFRNRNGFRVQQNSQTEHWRLLDPRDIRLAWGSKQACLEALEGKQPASVLESQTREPATVVLLHGLMRSRRSMMPIQKALESEGHTHTILFSYASTRRSIDDHALALKELLEDLPRTRRFSFAAHSMGNIVVRRMLNELETNDPTGLLDRFDAMVMLGPPNQGSSIARELAPTGIFGLVTGTGGLQLGRDWEELEKSLATPKFRFAIIAGDVDGKALRNPLIAPDNDLVVTVEEATLQGYEKLYQLPVSHTLMMNSKKVQRLAVDFLLNRQGGQAEKSDSAG